MTNKNHVDQNGGDAGPLTAKHLLAMLPSTNENKKPRTIDEYYTEAHDGPPIRGLGGLVGVLASHLGYFMVFIALGIANTGDAAEVGSMGFLLANEGFLEDVVQGDEGIVASALYIGMLLGGLGAGPLCDWTGRRSVLLNGLLLNSSFGVLMAFCANSWQLCVCRLLMGLGIGAIVSCVLALTSEHTPPSCRGAYMNFVAAFWMVGSIYVALLAYLMFGVHETSWRIYVLVNAAPSAIAFVLTSCFVPESARFLGLMEQYQKSTSVANRLAKSMGFTGEPLRLEEVKTQFPPGHVQPLLNVSLIGACRQLFRSFASLYKGPTRRRILFLQALWMTVSFGSGISLWITRVFAELSVANIYLMALFYALASIPGVLVAGILLDRVSRTWLLTTSLIATAAFLAVVAVLTVYHKDPVFIVLAACIFHSFMVVVWSVLTVVTAEVFPTSSRGTAMGLCAASGRFAQVVCHNVASLIESQHPAAVVIMASVSFGLAILFSIFSRLKNKTGAPLHDVEAGVE